MITNKIAKIKSIWMNTLYLVITKFINDYDQW